jgi:Protein of unknown function (DUF3551)
LWLRIETVILSFCRYRHATADVIAARPLLHIPGWVEVIKGGCRRVAPVSASSVMEVTMIRMIFSTAAALTFAAFSVQPTEAYEAPWCAVINTGVDVHWDCQYQSLEECYPTVLAGNRGFCNQNPYFVRPAERRPLKRRASQ